ncbi:response regulator transcription factor [Novosphingobium sp.]|uniref:response regulator transcription factor n=1 Tax=Novosphingobium sp. TaxID=1874826 RepID=UPI003B529ED4
MAHILVVEDDGETAALICAALEAEQHDVVHLADGLQALGRLGAERFDAATVDRMLPGIDGLTLVARIRARQITTPVLVISALGDVDERIAGLRAGGDDYLAKPFSPAEMVTRIDVLLRRARDYPEDGFLRAGPIALDLVKRRAWVDGETLDLVNKEFRLLEFLVRHAGHVVARQVIFEQVWGRYFEASDNLINVHIAKLRRKLERPDRAAMIETIKGEGYRLAVSQPPIS